MWLGANLTRNFFQTGAEVVVGPRWLGAEVTRGRGGSGAEVSEFPIVLYFAFALVLYCTWCRVCVPWVGCKFRLYLFLIVAFIGIKHEIQCIYICWAPREVLKPSTFRLSRCKYNRKSYLIAITFATVHVTNVDDRFCDGPGLLICNTSKPCINSTWIALLIHGFVPVKTVLLFMQ